MNRKYYAKYTRELLTEAAANSIRIADVRRYLQIPWSGDTHAHISRRLKQLGIDTSHFATAEPHVLRRALREIGVAYVCGKCGLRGEWNGEPIVTRRLRHSQVD